MSRSQVPHDEVAVLVSHLKQMMRNRRGAIARLARASGVSGCHISAIVHGRYRPSAEAFRRLNAALGGAPDAARPLTTRDQIASVVDIAADRAIANDAECVRLREELAAAEARVRAAVVALLGGES